MHKNELRANSTLINHANMVYELKARTIMINSGTESLKIQFENWLNITLQWMNCTLVPYVNNNEMKLRYVTYYPLHVNPYELVSVI